MGFSTPSIFDPIQLTGGYAKIVSIIRNFTVDVRVMLFGKETGIFHPSISSLGPVKSLPLRVSLYDRQARNALGVMPYFLTQK
jgi:hypothetical protein